MNKKFKTNLMFAALLLSIVPLSLAEEPTTQPEGDQQAGSTTEPTFAGGRTFNQTTPPSTQPAELPFVSPLGGSSSGSGNRPGDVQVGNGIGPNQGDRQPNAAVPVVPQAPPATKPAR